MVNKDVHLFSYSRFLPNLHLIVIYSLNLRVSQLLVSCIPINSKFVRHSDLEKIAGKGQTDRRSATLCLPDTTVLWPLGGEPAITWPFDSPQAISYWWSFGTEPLCLSAYEIFGANLQRSQTHAESSLRMRDITWLCSPVLYNLSRLHSLISRF